MSVMDPASSSSRYSLILTYYPDDQSVLSVSDLLYQSRDVKLLATLSGLPYQVGRRFKKEEVQSIHESLKSLKVGHRFETGVAKDLISFDPRGNKQEPKTKEASKTPRTRSTRVGYGLVGLVAISIAAWLIFALLKEDQTQSTKSNSENYIARLEKAEADVEYRPKQDLLWQKAIVPLALNEQDALRTHDRARATLAYRDGSRVYIKPNTLIIIGTHSEADQRIELNDGALRAQLTRSTIGKVLSVVTPQGTLEIPSPTANETHETTQIETQFKKGEWSIAVTSGKASMRSNSNPTAPLDINQHEKIKANANGVTEKSTYRPTVQLLSPESEARLTFNASKNSNFHFRWELLPEDCLYVFELSSDPDMKSILLKHEVKESSVHLSYLDPGVLYWRVRAQLDGIEYQSPTRVLHVEKSN